MRSSNRFASQYTHVVHATEEARRKKFNGCVSRQHLRATLRREAFDSIREQFPMRWVKGVQLHRTKTRAELRRISRDNARTAAIDLHYK